jgi:hypothetical protein
MLKPKLNKPEAVLTCHGGGKVGTATVVMSTKITENTVLQLFREVQSFTSGRKSEEE